jgi:hypothetical protein
MRQGQRREDAETAGVIGHQLLAILVRLARNANGGLHPERRDLRRGGRYDRGSNAALVHVVKRFLDRPMRERRVAAADQVHGGKPGGRNNMMVHVDAVGICLAQGAGDAKHDGRCDAAENGGSPGKEASPVHRRRRLGCVGPRGVGHSKCSHWPVFGAAATPPAWKIKVRSRRAPPSSTYRACPESNMHVGPGMRPPARS